MPPHHGEDGEEHPEGEECKAGAGKHGGGGEGGHGKPGHGPPGGPGGRRRGGKRGQKGKKKPEDEEDTSDEDESEAEEDDDDDCADDDEEEKNPGLRRAGRVAGRAWKRQNGVEGKIKNMTPEQKKEIRKVKRAARIAFRKRAEKA